MNHQPTVNDFLDLMRTREDLALKTLRDNLTNKKAEWNLNGRFGSDSMFIALTEVVEEGFRRHAEEIVGRLDKIASTSNLEAAELRGLAGSHLLQFLISARAAIGVDGAPGAGGAQFREKIDSRFEELKRFVRFLLRQQEIGWTSASREPSGRVQAQMGDSERGGKTAAQSQPRAGVSKHSGGSPPSDVRPGARVRFRYSSHDGRYVLGQGDWVFETRWSKASDTAIHASNDAPNIAGIAIAPGVSAIAEVTSDIVDRLDFTSRVRTPQVGEVLILENRNGYLAAIRIVRIQNAARGGDHEVEIDYRILTDRSRDFSDTEATTFDLYSTSIPEARALADQTATELEALWSDHETEPEHGGVGHNRPPVELPIAPDEYTEVMGSLRDLRDEATQPELDASRLRRAGSVLARAGAKIVIWVGQRLEAAADAFAEQVGKGLAIVVLSTGAWLAFANHLQQLVAYIARIISG